MAQQRLSPEREAAIWAGAAHATEFFMGTADVQRALAKLAAALDEVNVPYALAGAMALNEYGFRRVTEDVDILLTREGLAAFKAHWLGRGYVEKFAGSKGLRDTENNVTIDVLLTGEYPGDGKPKPVVFPDPSIAIRGERIAVLPVEKLVELKLASGLSAVHRAKDIGDVVELIKHAKLARELGDALDPSVRAKYLELWDALQNIDEEY